MSIPFSLYIHLPWCVKKCPYCDFNSHLFNNFEQQENQYINALIKDMEFESLRVKDREINTVFFGGGTPSLFSVNGIEKILNAINKYFKIASTAEITLEANPGTFETEKFQGFFQVGINRLSIGVQSFSDKKLSSLGRIHDSKEAVKAIEIAKHSGFENLNIDLMYGLPEQTNKEALEDLQTAINFQPSHISWYELTIEPNTVFYSKPPKLPDDTNVWDMHLAGKERLEKASYQQYEVSAYGIRQCQHNINYWQFGDYLGLGAGAHGKLTNKESKQVERFARVKLPQSYIEKTALNLMIAEHRTLSESDLIFEFMLNAFRLSNGFEIALFEQRTGLSADCISELLKYAKEKNWITVNQGIVRTTAIGKQYLNEVISLFVPEK